MLAQVSIGTREARGYTEALGRLDPVDFDLAYYVWPLHKVLVWFQIRNLFIKDESFAAEMHKQTAARSPSI
jgi:hypothetical protein